MAIENKLTKARISIIESFEKTLNPRLVNKILCDDKVYSLFNLINSL